MSTTLCCPLSMAKVLDYLITCYAMLFLLFCCCSTNLGKAIFCLVYSLPFPISLPVGVAKFALVICSQLWCTSTFFACFLSFLFFFRFLSLAHPNMLASAQLLHVYSKCSFFSFFLSSYWPSYVVVDTTCRYFCYSLLLDRPLLTVTNVVSGGSLSLSLSLSLWAPISAVDSRGSNIFSLDEQQYSCQHR